MPEETARVRKIHHFRNIPNGLKCGCPMIGQSQHMVRIQGTTCEQHLWGKLLLEAGSEFMYGLAIGDVCIVHDAASVDKETRACWQGLSFIRYAAYRAWNGNRGVLTVPEERSRNGLLLNKYWEVQYQSLDREARHFLRYFNQFYTHPHSVVWLKSCYSVRKAAEANRLKREEEKRVLETAVENQVKGLVSMPYGPFGPME